MWNDFQNIYTERIAAAIEARLDRPLDVTAFISSENWLDDTIRAAQAIQARDKGQGNPDEAVLQAMETFLAGHNTGVLSTGWGQEVHGTPIEYVYEKGTFYFFSEGGRKFINLYRNRHAAFSVCDAFTDVQHLAGLQAEGSVRFIEPDDEAYPRIAARKGIAPQRLAAMPVVLHVIALDVAQMSSFGAASSRPAVPCARPIYSEKELSMSHETKMNVLCREADRQVIRVENETGSAYLTN